MTQPDLRPLYLCGPTASGKTSLAVQLAEAIDGEIINADAYQIYRGIEQISAAPTAEELSSATHHLFSEIPYTENCDAMRYREMALQKIEEVQQRGKTPIITGGSGLYLKFLTHGPSPVPASDPETRAELEKLDDTSLIEQLKSLDPQGAKETNLLNRRYVIRALEICILSSQPMSEIKSTWKKESAEISKTLCGIYIDWPREELYQRINQRTESLVNDAALNEVANTREKISETAKKAIGYREICEHLDEQITREKCIEHIAIGTRRYAKRQQTWFRKETWLTTVSPNLSPEEICQLIKPS